ncbi:MAG: tetratricopeptide repeat protein [Candidatus Obscuribacterales bacterium]|nr:tetratricopeptide repeat protein [Candidatus Obscuribacterales bacterium]
MKKESLALFLLLILASSVKLAAAKDTSVFVGDELLKGRVAVSESKFPLKSMSDLQVLIDKANQLYARDQYLEAEPLFKQGIDYLKANKASGESLALLCCNLGACYRQEKRFDEATKFFQEAVTTCKSSKLKPETCEYVAKQYAVLLRKQGKEFEAAALLTGARASFAAVAVNSARATSENSRNEGLSSNRQSMSSPSSGGGISGYKPADNTPAVMTGMEQRDVQSLVKKDAAEQLARSAQREPGETSWHVDEPNVTKSSNDKFFATVRVEFTTMPVNEKGKFKINMIGYWFYEIRMEPDKSFKILDKKMPFDTNASTIQKLN